MAKVTELCNIYSHLTKEDLENEIWIDVLIIERKYSISNAGRIRNEKRLLKSNLHKGIHYPSIVVNQGGKQKKFYIHRLVAIHFIPNPENKREVNHKNGNKKDNRVENLEWVTPKENTQHAHISGFVPSGKKGGDNPRHKKVEQWDLSGNLIKIWNGLREASRGMNVHNSSIRGVCVGSRKTSHGFIWKYQLNGNN